MNSTDLLRLLLETTLAGSTAVLLVLALRVPVRRWCSNAERVETVPVTLAYAFTFKVLQGQTRVHVGKQPR